MNLTDHHVMIHICNDDLIDQMIFHVKILINRTTNKSISDLITNNDDRNKLKLHFNDCLCTEIKNMMMNNNNLC